jgi:multiple sugar transport system substrate-binding protein
MAMKFLNWASSKEMAIKGMMGNITMARSSVWDDPAVRSKMNPGLIATRAFAAKNGTPVDRPYMSAVGEARDLIGEILIESINTKGASAKLDQLAQEKVKRVNELLQDSGEYGK